MFAARAAKGQNVRSVNPIQIAQNPSTYTAVLNSNEARAVQMAAYGELMQASSRVATSTASLVEKSVASIDSAVDVISRGTVELAREICTTRAKTEVVKNYLGRVQNKKLVPANFAGCFKNAQNITNRQLAALDRVRKNVKEEVPELIALGSKVQLLTSQNLAAAGEAEARARDETKLQKQYNDLELKVNNIVDTANARSRAKVSGAESNKNASVLKAEGRKLQTELKAEGDASARRTATFSAFVESPFKTVTSLFGLGTSTLNAGSTAVTMIPFIAGGGAIGAAAICLYVFYLWLLANARFFSVGRVAPTASRTNNGRRGWWGLTKGTTGKTPDQDLAAIAQGLKTQITELEKRLVDFEKVKAAQETSTRKIETLENKVRYEKLSSV
jgi:hypothetical protein